MTETVGGQGAREPGAVASTVPGPQLPAGWKLCVVSEPRLDMESVLIVLI